MRFLITRPKHDKANHYLHAWSQPLIDKALERGFEVYDLEREKAARKTVESYLKKQKPTLVMLNGHGSATQVRGHDNEVLIESNDNLKLLKDTNIVVRACSSGGDLGKKIIEAGAKGFIGFKAVFIFRPDPDKVGHPLDDELAGPCLRASNKAVAELIKGATAAEAYKASMNAHDEELIKAKSSAGDSVVAMCLYWNMSNMVVFI